MRSHIHRAGCLTTRFWIAPLHLRARLSSLALLLLGASSCTHSSGSRISSRSEAFPLVPFTNTRYCPSGGGVDLSLHSRKVNANPRSNPRRAWDDPSILTIMAHGKRVSPKGPVLIDERHGATRLLTPGDLADELEGNDQLARQLSTSQCIVLYACNSGAATPSGFPSFAERLATLLNKPVVAPSGILMMHSGAGNVKGRGSFLKFEPSGRFFR